MNKFFKAFSLIELMIALVIIFVVTATVIPAITKKLSSNSITVNTGANTRFLEDCSAYSQDCALCTNQECNYCKKECLNDEYKNTPDCTCVKCNTKFPNCASCRPSVCEKCNGGYGYNDSTGDCTLCNAGTYSSGSTECINASAGYYVPSDGNSTQTICPAQYYSSGGASACTACSSGYYSPAGASGCSACTSKYGTECISCSASNCTECTSTHKLSSDTTGADACTPKFDCSGTNFMQIGNLCVTRYNMGDLSVASIPSNVSLYDGYDSWLCGDSNSLCCLVSNTSFDCNAKNGGYSGCHRTVCNAKTANYICSNFNYGGKTWRLPTESEVINWPNYSANYGTSGLMLCDEEEIWHTAWCNWYNGATAYSVWLNTYPQDYNLKSGTWFRSDSHDNARKNSVRCVTNM